MLLFGNLPPTRNLLLGVGIEGILLAGFAASAWITRHIVRAAGEIDDEKTAVDRANSDK